MWLAALAALLVLGSSCGDDDGGGDDEGPGDSPSGGDKDSGSGASDDDKDAASGGGAGDDDPPASGGSGDSGSSAGGTGGDVTPIDAGMVDSGGIEVCGAETCADPMCCADAFVSRCGIRVNARACLPPAPTSTMSDERCPSVSIMNGAFNIPSCCTEDMKCGIDAAAAGMGCISLEEVRAFSTRNMADGGGGGPTAGIMWPEPKACN